MNIVLTSWGTTGDVQPFLALASGLVHAGHRIRLCTSEIYRQRVIQAGADFFPVGLPFEPERFDQLMDQIIKIRNPLASAMVVAKEGILSGAQTWYDDCLRAMRSPIGTPDGFDLSISHSADIPGQEAAIRADIPNITVSYCPAFIRSITNPPPPMVNLGKPVSWLLWKLIELVMVTKVDPLFNQFIGQVGGQPRRMVGFAGMYSPLMNLVAASPTIAPPPRDLPANHRFTGVWTLDEADYHPPLDLLDFLDAGDKPIVVSFGSMGGTHDPTPTILEAIRRTGQRVIIQSGWGNLGVSEGSTDQDPRTSDLFCVDYVPHGFLFRQAKLVIHHGGAGTTTAVCRAGVPSIVVPHLADQPYWAGLLQQRGLAPKPLHRHQLSVAKLAQRVQQTLNSPQMFEAAKSVGQQMTGENGVKTAIRLIEAFAEEQQKTSLR